MASPRPSYKSTNSHRSSNTPPNISRRHTTLPSHATPSRLLMPAVRHGNPSSSSDWIGIPLRFDVVQDHLELQGYQMYAVEKWIVERNRPVIVLAVYTGDPSHKISVTALAPSSSLSPTETQVEWDKALHHLRRDGARAKDTPHGILMATSLAHFRSDYTIVHIPDGNFLAVRTQLYTNINLLRMGCSGRSALTLQEPSDATKDRFICTYQLPENTLSHNVPITSTDFLPLPPALSKTRSHSQSNSHHGSVLNFNASQGPKHSTDSVSLSASTSIAKAKPSVSISKSGLGLGLPSVTHESTTKSKEKEVRGKTKDRALFNATVIELVKLIQASLSIFGLFGSPATSIQLDGLLCDDTVEGVRRWIIDIGEPCVGLEPMERIADPVFVSALLSLVLSIRNKLVTLGFSHVVPKDPFLQPHIFAYALATYVQSSTPAATPSIPPIYSTGHHAQSSSTSSAVAPSHNLAFGHPQFGPHLLPPLHQHHQHHFLPAATSSSITLPGGSKAPLPSVVLTRELVETIETAYESKVRTPEGRGGVRRVLREKLEDLTRVGGESDSDGAAERRGTANVVESGVDGRIGGTGAAPGGGGGIGGGVGLATSGGQLLSGIGKLVGGSGGSHSGPGSVLEGTHDMEAFVRLVIGKELKGKGKGKAKERKRETGEAALGHGIYGREKEKDASVGISVRALWSGGVTTVVRLREWEKEREIRVEKQSLRKRPLRGIGDVEKALSDGDLEDSARNEKSDGGTEEESDMVVGPGANGFGPMMWGEKVQKKLESWTGIARKRGHASLDLSAPSSIPEVKVSRAQTLPLSPTLPPVVFADDVDDDDLLSSGQVSPIDHLPNSFNILHDGRLLETSLADAKAERERKVLEFDQKRPWSNRVYQSRITSWADPISARNVLDGEDEEGDVGVNKKEEMKPSTLTEGSVAEEDEDSGELVGDWSDGIREAPRRTLVYDAQRRRSFHDLSSLRDMRVLKLEQMRVDVELCGQLLIMARREEHLQNVMACLQVLTTSLSNTNALLREDHQNHLPFIANLDEHTKVISQIDAESARADKTSQATNTLRYESEQFRVPDLWHIATPPRQKVLELREKVFGTGGRRLPPGVHGAHGLFNRLQWTLDDQERLVDYMGRTESEAEEESSVDPKSVFTMPPEEEEEDLVEHPGIKPMWLLRFFTSWGARWGAPAPSHEASDHQGDAANSNGAAVVEDTSGSGSNKASAAERSPPLSSR